MAGDGTLHQLIFTGKSDQDIELLKPVNSQQIVHHTESRFQSQDTLIDLVDHMDRYINSGSDQPWLLLLHCAPQHVAKEF